MFLPFILPIPEIHKYLSLLKECKNSPPSTCKLDTCHGFSNSDYCRWGWKELDDHLGPPNACSSDTTGKIEDDCQVECGVCKGGCEYI